VRCLPSPPVQLITGSWRDTEDLYVRVEAALRGGIRWVQLRAKLLSARDLHEAAAMLAPLLHEAGARFVVNDRVDIALAVGADGVHLPENGMGTAAARRLLGAGAWIARSVHSLDGVRAAGDSVADAVQFGPVFVTASKREFGVPQGLGLLREAASAANASGIVLMAVGGLDAGRSRECLMAGASAVSVIGAIWEADDVESAASAWRVG
jgi:thiamine-phosphate pyrophosphorylase